MDQLDTIFLPLNLEQVPEDWVCNVFDSGGSISPPKDQAEIAWSPDIPTLVRLARGLKHCQSKSDEDEDSFWEVVTDAEFQRTLGLLPEAKVHRNLVTLLYWLMVQYEDSVSLTKALLASNTYLALLQIDGCSAYGLFMPFIYRQAMFIVKKWSDLVVKKAILPSEKEDMKMYHYGLQLLTCLDQLTKDIPLKSSYSSIVLTIETVFHVLGKFVIYSSHSTVELKEKCHAILYSFFKSKHTSSPLSILKVMDRKILQFLNLGDSIFDDVLQHQRMKMKALVQVHREMVTFVQELHAHVRTCALDVEEDDEEMEEEGDDSTIQQFNNISLALLQHCCLQMPEKSESRNHVMKSIEELLLSSRFYIRNDQNDNHSKEAFFQFLNLYSQNAKALYRVCAVQLASKVILHASVSSSLPMVKSLLLILIQRSQDKISTVRAKAINGLTSTLFYAFHAEESTAKMEIEADETRQEFRNVLLECLQSSATLKELIESFQQGLTDEKTLVRKAAIQALEVIYGLNINCGQSSSTSDVEFQMTIEGISAIHQRCSDTSVTIRQQALTSLTTLLLNNSQNQDLQRLWNLGVLPLTLDPEMSVQHRALDAIEKVIVHQIMGWYKAVQSDSVDIHQYGHIWIQLSQIDGVMTRCVQKALRQLVRSSKLNVSEFIQACQFAIECSYEPDDEEEENTDVHAPYRSSYWSFSWIVLEEFAKSGHFLSCINNTEDEHQVDFQFIIECWKGLIGESASNLNELSDDYSQGAQRILKIMSILASVIDASDATQIADGLLTSLIMYQVPQKLIGCAITALFQLCTAKAPTADEATSITMNWASNLLGDCELKLMNLVQNASTMLIQPTESEKDNDQLQFHISSIQRQLLTIGEVALIGFDQDDEKSRKGKVALLDISSRLISLIQSLLPPEIGSLSSLVQENEQEMEQKSSTILPLSVRIPASIRSVAFLTLGKVCLRDQKLAKSCMTMLVREMHTAVDDGIRSNILLLLGDLCIRYTSVVDLYIPDMTRCLIDSSVVVRRHALLLLSQLILQDYIKLKDEHFPYFIHMLEDEDPQLRELSKYIISMPLLRKFPHLITNQFVDLMFAFNQLRPEKEKHKHKCGDDKILTLFSGSTNAPKRHAVYRFCLRQMQDEQKLQVSMKIVNEILDNVVQGELILSSDPAVHGRTEMILKDTLLLLSCAEIKLSAASSNGSSSKDTIDDMDEDLQIMDTQQPSQDHTIAPSQSKKALQVAAAKDKLLNKISKKIFLEQVVPVIIALKHKLEAHRSPVMRYLVHYMYELFKDEQSQVREILRADTQMADEILYDLRKYGERLEASQSTMTPSSSSKSSSSSSLMLNNTSSSSLMSPGFGLRNAYTPGISAKKGRRRSFSRTPLSTTKGGHRIDPSLIPMSTPRLRRLEPNSISRHARTPREALSGTPYRAHVQEGTPVQKLNFSSSKKRPQAKGPLDANKDEENQIKPMIFTPHKIIRSQDAGEWNVSVSADQVKKMERVTNHEDESSSDSDSDSEDDIPPTARLMSKRPLKKRETATHVSSIR